MNYLTNYYKNLSEQLQEKVNHLQKLLKESAPDPKAESWDRHGQIVDSIVKHHASKYPHKRVGDFAKNVKASAEHIKGVLDKHPEAPFRNPNEAIQAIHPHAIEGNYGLEERIYDAYPDRTMGGDITELPQGEYEELQMDNEADYADELHNKVIKDVGQMKDAEDYR